MLSDEQKLSLTECAKRYNSYLDEEILSYLEGRGIIKETADRFQLGKVLEPHAGHELATGMLSIPYLTPSGVVGLKFRRLDDGTPKYLWPSGQKVGMYNVLDLHKDSDVIAICEGEIDTIVISGLVGIPAVGVPGVSQWKPHFPKLFEAYERVLVFADNDAGKKDGNNPGFELAKRIKEDVDKAEIVVLPEGHDVNEVYLSTGSDWFVDRIRA